jgi:hypothetical protein
MYLFIHVGTDFCQYRDDTNQYVLVRTRSYEYILFLTGVKKVQAGLEPVIFCILSAELTPKLWGYTPHSRTLLVFISAEVCVYIMFSCQTPCLCTWLLMMNQLCWSRSAAATAHDIPGLSLDLHLT